MLLNAKLCQCGSGLSSRWVFDARGIEIARVCDYCQDARLAIYRHEVLIDPNYTADEPIEPDDGYVEHFDEG
jgi:hypothetical protein